MIPSMTFLLFVPPHPYCPFYEDYFYIKLRHHWASLVAQRKPPACNEGDLGSFSGWGRSPGEGNGNPLQYSCLENPMDGEAWWATVHVVTELDMTSLSLSFRHHMIFTSNICISEEKSDLPPNP